MNMYLLTEKEMALNSATRFRRPDVWHCHAGCDLNPVISSITKRCIR